MKILSYYLKCVWLVTLLAACIKASYAVAITKEEGMGGVGVAYPQSSTGANFNTAIITDLDDRYDADACITYQWGRDYIRGSLEPIINGKAGPQCKYFPIFVGGICKKATPKITVGASIDGRRISKYALDKPFPVFGHGKRQGIETIVGIIMPSVAYKLNECHSFGIGFPIAIGRIKVNGLQNGAALSLYPDAYSNHGYDYAHGYGIRVGWLWHINCKLNFGASYSTRLLSATHFHKYRGFIPLKGKLELPAELRIGFAYKWHERSTIALDLQYNFMNQERTLSNSALSTAPFGSKHGPGLGWPNQLVVRIGTDCKLTDKLTVRSGIITFNPFVRSSNTIIHFVLPLYVVRTFVTAGLSWQINCSTEVNIAYLYGVRRFVRGKPIPTFANGHVDIDYENHNIFLGFGNTF
jgi:long-chain fatty acid transport protein